MTLSNWLSSLTIIVIYWGFAGALGHALYQYRHTQRSNTHLLWISITGLGFGLQTLALPFTIWQQISIIAISFLIIGIFLQQPISLPVWLWGHRFAMRYMSLTMLLAIVWSLTHLPILLAFSISICALLAGLYSWQYSLEFD